MITLSLQDAIDARYAIDCIIGTAMNMPNDPEYGSYDYNQDTAKDCREILATLGIKIIE